MLPILFLVTDSHTVTASTDRSCLAVVENPGLLESRGILPSAGSYFSWYLHKKLINRGNSTEFDQKTAFPKYRGTEI